MKEIFDRHEKIEEERPAMVHTPVWWLEKNREEWGETYAITPNDPTPEELEEIKKEGADMFLTWVGLMRSVGISAEVAIQAIHERLDHIEVTYPVELFDGRMPFAEGYALARPDKKPPIDIYNASSFSVDDLID